MGTRSFALRAQCGRGRPRSQVLPRKVNGQRRRSPRKCDSCATVTVIMYQEFVTDAFGIDDKAFRAIWTETDNFANEAIAGNLDGREVTLSVESESVRPRGNQSGTRG